MFSFMVAGWGRLTVQNYEYYKGYIEPGVGVLWSATSVYDDARRKKQNSITTTSAFWRIVSENPTRSEF